MTPAVDEGLAREVAEVVGRLEAVRNAMLDQHVPDGLGSKSMKLRAVENAIQTLRWGWR